MPPLVGSLLLVLIAALTGWVPVGGMTSGDLHGGAWLLDVLRHLPVPTLALALPLAATLERLQARSMAEAAAQPFVRASLARGRTTAAALRLHAWPVSLAPVLGVYGVIVGALFSGSFVVEVVTAWPGLGRLLFDALHARDVWLVAGCGAAGAAFLAVATPGGGHRACRDRSARAAGGVPMTARAALAARGVRHGADRGAGAGALRRVPALRWLSCTRRRCACTSMVPGCTRCRCGWSIGSSSSTSPCRAAALPLPWSAAASEPVFLLGADGLGRDVLSRILHGARPSLGLALLATLGTLLIGGAARRVGGPGRRPDRDRDRESR